MTTLTPPAAPAVTPCRQCASPVKFRAFYGWSIIYFCALCRVYTAHRRADAPAA